MACAEPDQPAHGNAELRTSPRVHDHRTGYGSGVETHTTTPTAVESDPGHGVSSPLALHRSHGLPPHIAPRWLRIWLPPRYAAEHARRYPVVYLQDGQNLFDDAEAFGGVSWRLGDTATRLIARRKIAPCILVGIDNVGAHRLDDYTPVPMHGRGGHADDYGRLLLTQIKPFVDHRYRTLPDAAHTAIAGASLGGLCALHLALRHPHVFGHAAALSPTLAWGHDWLPRTLNRLPARLPVRIWIDAGKREPPELRRQLRRLRELLQDRGWRVHRQARRADLRCPEIAGGRHDERSWGDRMHRVLQFLLPPEPRQRRR